jgi:hypothetical protein
MIRKQTNQRPLFDGKPGWLKRVDMIMSINRLIRKRWEIGHEQGRKANPGIAATCAVVTTVKMPSAYTSRALTIPRK